MKKTILFFAAALALAACQRPVEEAPVGKLVTIHASVPSESTKVALTPDGNGLHLAWEEGDCLRVISGGSSSRFDIKAGFTDHEADFTGNEVGGTLFDIIYPGTFESVAEAEASDYGYQVQDGNGSTAHLRYAALLEGVNTYSDITFSSAWADAHGGSIKKAGAVKLSVKLPAGVTSVERVSIDLNGKVLSLGLKNVDVSASEQLLTAYIMTPWDDVELDPGAPVEVTVTDAQGSIFGRAFNLASSATLSAGRVSVFNVTEGVKEYPFAGGSGTESDPWLIANARQLENMMNMYKDSEETDFMWYFKLVKDVDASGIAWVSLNRTSPYKRGVDFDGDGHTIKGLTADGASFAYPSFAGVLYGNIKDVTFDAATITASNKKAGVVAGYVGTTGVTGKCDNVHVTNSTLTGTNALGGFAGWVTNNAVITNCSAKATVSSSAGNAGGFVGYAEKGTFLNCSFEGTVNNTHSGKNTRCGGFIGNAAKGLNVQSCSVLNSTVSAPNGQRIAGFVGQLGDDSNGKNADLIKDCLVENCTITGGALSGGFVGVQYNDIENCGVKGGSVTLRGTNSGGFSGFAQNGNILNCYTSAAVSAGSNTPVGGIVGITYAVTIYNSYASGSITGSGANLGVLVGQCTVTTNDKGEATCYPALITGCIGWSASLPAVASNTVGATVSNCYVGTEGTVSSQAQTLGWDSNIWDMSGSEPVIKPGADATEGVKAAFMGDSITWQWTRSGFHPEFFIEHGYINKGISGENTTEMLGRFPYDILPLKPKVVVIMGGTNDIAQSVTQDGIMANIKAMSEMADAAGIKVVLCSVTPCNRTYAAVGGPKTLAILPLNEAIKAYAESKGYPYCNYYPVLADAEDGLKAEYMKNGTDDLHPNREGYIAMEAVIQPILESLLN